MVVKGLPDFFVGEDFRFLWLPIITTILTILIKIFHKDRRMRFSWSDCAVAPNLMVTAVLIFLIKMSLLAYKIKYNQDSSTQSMDMLMTEFCMLIVMIIGMCFVTFALREHGWRHEAFDVTHLVLKPSAIIWSNTVGAAYIIIAYSF